MSGDYTDPEFSFLPPEKPKRKKVKKKRNTKRIYLIILITIVLLAVAFFVVKLALKRVKFDGDRNDDKLPEVMSELAF